MLTALSDILPLPPSSSPLQWGSSECFKRIQSKWMRCSREWIRCIRVAIASDSQCRRHNCSGFDPSILQYSGIWGATDEAVLHSTYMKKIQKSPCWAYFLKFGYYQSVQICFFLVKQIPKNTSGCKNRVSHRTRFLLYNTEAFDLSTNLNRLS